MASELGRVLASHTLPARRPSFVALNRSDLQTALVVVLLASAVIHLGVTPVHLREYTGYGVFFVSAAILQVGAAVLCIRRATRGAVWAAGALSVLIAAVWLVSRTVGLPVGPDAGEPEPIGMADIVSTLYEFIAAGVAIPLGAQLRPRTPQRLHLSAAAHTWAMFAGWITIGAIFVGH